MIVSKRSDQVFQLSLTEIAFTISFILLLLLGYLVMKETNARKRAEEKLAAVQDLDAARKAFDDARAQLRGALAGAGAAKPDEVISNLQAEAKASAERDRLLALVKDLEAQISALSEVKQAAADAAKGAWKRETVDRVVSALAIQAEAERAIKAAREPLAAPAGQPASGAASAASASAQSASASGGSTGSSGLAPTPGETRAEVRRSIDVTAAVDRALRESGGKPLPPGKEAEAVAGLVRSAQAVRGLEGTGKDVKDLLQENANLRGQLENLRKRFSGTGKGLDHAPCWADEAGNIEYLFLVELRPGAVIVKPAEWSERRRVDAGKLPGVEALIAGPVDYGRFQAEAQPILAHSKRQDPECRHFVILRNTIETRREADQARWMVERFFYKRETNQ